MKSKENEKFKALKKIVILQLVCIYFSTIGIISKKAAQLDFLSAQFIILFLGLLILMLIYAILWQRVLKSTSLFIAYANKGTSILWTLLWASLFFNESISIQNIIGVLLIIIGIAVVAKDGE